MLGNFEYSFDNITTGMGLFSKVRYLSSATNTEVDGYKLNRYCVEELGHSNDWSVDDDQNFEGIPVVSLNMHESIPYFNELPARMVPILIVRGADLRNFEFIYKHGMSGVFVINSKISGGIFCLIRNHKI